MSDTPRTDINHLTVETLRTMRGTGTKIVLASVARQLERELNEAKRDAARYQVVRRMNDREFYELLQRCVRQDLRFDDEVDRIGGIK